ncbi:MAG: ABC transporter permease [Polyangiaceae bacterium]
MANPKDRPKRPKLAPLTSTRVATYLPDNSLRHGYMSLFSDIARELLENRWLTFQLFKRDMFAFYKQSLLGVFWVVFVPLVTVGTFVMLRGSGVVAAGEMTTPYPIYAGVGVAIWQLFSQGLVSGANSLVSGGEMITRINFSKKSLIIASLGRTVVSFLVVVLLLVGLFVHFSLQGFQPYFGIGSVLFVVSLLPLVLLTVGLSFVLALLNGIVRDIGTMLSMVLTLLLLLTPVLYERPALAPDAGTLPRMLDTVTGLNPLYYLVVGPRDLLLQGQLSDPRGFFIASAVATVTFLIALVGFHLTETRIAERI